MVDPANILVFTGKSDCKSVRLAISKTERNQNFELSFSIFPSLNSKLRSINLLTIEDLHISLSYRNRILIKKGSIEHLIDISLSKGYWATITIHNQEDVSSILINGSLQGQENPFRGPLLQASFQYFTIGSDRFRGLIAVPKFSPYPSFDILEYHESLSSRPFHSLEEFLHWKATDKMNASRIPLKKHSPTHERELCICHDMGSNYKIDKRQNSMECTFKYYQWARTNIFIYFSHSRVTIPPPGWTEWAHRNGAKCLGTLITEWDEGSKETAILLDNPELYATKLIDLMEFYGFDGWLLNFECETNRPRDLLDFVGLLTALAHSRFGDDSCIMWYDSVILNGKISWKSKLCPENIEFFNNCDAFFTDYHWRPGMPQESVNMAGSRNWKVYTGTDVHGRGTWGGGMFNSRIGAQDCPNTSVALFAPGWSYEKSGGNRDGFLNLNQLLWHQSVVPIIDKFGEIYKDRPKLSKNEALSGWKVEVFTHAWVQTPNKNSQWEITDDFEFVSSFMPTRRVVEVNLSKFGLLKNEGVVGKVLVKGTGPNVNDPFLVTLEAFDSNGRMIMSATSNERIASDQWKLISLEIPVHDVAVVRWIEQGQDAEYWQGYYGARFKDTNVVVKAAGGSLLDCFYIKKFTEPINTWFNECQGRKLYSRGRVISENSWNSVRDGDQLPDYSVLVENPFNQEVVYHGTSSLKLQQRNIDLFHMNLQLPSFSIKIIYQGNAKLILKDTNNQIILHNKITKEKDNGWDVDEYYYNEVSEVIGMICIENNGDSYLGGLHFDIKPSDFQLGIKEKRILWNVKSFGGEDVFDIEIELGYEMIPEFVRHFDIYVDAIWKGRGYSNYMVVQGVPNGARVVNIVVEKLSGEISKTLEFTLSDEEFKAANPFISKFN
ncbi:unnamed protein product [Blepharisma stoltei]|uniref:Cytosolic endo-beta-N-acetylglucosaminidase TIM barrel domain-containing protein n=1 Tax=Blepharisma stoltei TaxID=1481888 RepID=A0AAU9KF64_9CILI|nr:unnamed protein product [Blepharisma stoltei]